MLCCCNSAASSPLALPDVRGVCAVILPMLSSTCKCAQVVRPKPALFSEHGHILQNHTHSHSHTADTTEGSVHKKPMPSVTKRCCMHAMCSIPPTVPDEPTSLSGRLSYMESSATKSAWEGAHVLAVPRRPHLLLHYAALHAPLSSHTTVAYATPAHHYCGRD